jgi:uroporphyrinogen-III synthase
MNSLSGRRVLVTRTRERAQGLVDALHDSGAEAVVVPLIATQPIASPSEIAEAAAALQAAPDRRWAVFTSATAVRLVSGASGAWLSGAGRAGVRLGAVGESTAAAIAAAGGRADVVAADPDSSGLASALETAGVRGATVWFPSAEAAAATLAERLRAAGATVHVQPVYRTVMPADAPRRLAVALDAGVDAITLTSGSTARHLLRALGGRELAPGTVIACIGEQTAEAAHAAGLAATITAEGASVAGLVAALERAFEAGTALPGRPKGGC